MNENDNFIITLPSDSFNSNFQNNTLSNFTTELKDAIDLKRQYEVGIAEVIYPTSIENIPFNVNIYLEISSPNGDHIIVSKTIANVSITQKKKFSTSLKIKWNLLITTR